MKHPLLSLVLLAAWPTLAMAQDKGTIVQFANKSIPVLNADRSMGDAANLPALPARILEIRGGAYVIAGKNGQNIMVRAIDVVARDVPRPDCGDGAVAALRSGSSIAGSTMGSGSAANCKLKVD